MMPERFELEYADADGTKKRPVMIHRALLGSMERFIGILLEHYGGALPLWLSPVQASMIPISEKFIGLRAGRCMRRVPGRGICGSRSTTGRKKWATKSARPKRRKIPYMAIVGEKEVAMRKPFPFAAISRRRPGPSPVSQFVAAVDSEASKPS